MNKNSLTTAVIAGLAGVAGIANMASAVNINPDGLGQVLLYPYYTVNNNQNTQLSVVNTTSIAKAVKVRFLEGYNSREVLDFNLFLSPFDVWVASVFPLSTVSAGSTAAAIATADNSCTAPVFAQGTINGAGYQAFLNYAYSGIYEDTGPTGLDRTREGHFEMISMADLGGAVAADVTHDKGLPPGCDSAEADFEAGDTIAPPTSGLFGSAAVVNVAQGTFYAYNADALDGFTAVTLATKTGSLRPSLSDVNDPGLAGTATSYVFDDGALLTSSYTAGGTTGIDAVSSLFMASNIYNEYESAGTFSGTDWVVNFPTKRFYVDTLYNTNAPVIPFEEAFGLGASGKGLSCTEVGITIYDREENTSSPTGCGFSPCPPGQPPSSLCHETNVITFNTTGTNSILASTLTSNIQPIGAAGWAGLSLLPSGTTGQPHQLRPAANTNVFFGLPITGFQATQYTNGNVGGVLSNYSGAYRHRISRLCTNGTGACS